MAHVLTAKKILILVSNGVDEGAMSEVQREMVKTGAIVKTVSTEPGLVNSWNKNASAVGAWGLYFPVDQQIGQTLGSDFDALIVPSGARSIQKLSTNPHAERIVASFLTAGKPMAFIGDAVELLARVSLAKDIQVAGPEKSEALMVAAGAVWQGTGETVHGTVMTGEALEMTQFINNIIAHLGQEPEMKAAA